MQTANMTSNALIQSVVHKSLNHAIEEIGLPEFPQKHFDEEMTPLLRSFGGVFDDNEVSRAKLWKSILQGEIFATEIRGDGTLVIYVRGGVAGSAVDLRLTCHEHQWHIEAITSVHSRPVSRSPWFYRGIFATSVVIAAILGYALHRPHVEIVKQPIPVATAPASTSSSMAESTAPAAAADKPAPQKLTFTLKQNMPLHDLSAYLAEHKLVTSAEGFDMVMKKAGVDRHLKPGTFTFTSAMNENQIIQVLKQGPAQ